MSLQHNKSRFLPAWFALCACVPVLLPTSSVQAAAMDKQIAKETSIHINQNVIVVSGRMSLGAIHGQSGEMVYIPELNHKLSELNWGINGVYMLGLGGSVVPLSWLKLNADIWLKLNDGNASMEDYDWFVLDYQYTHLSRHDNLDLTRGVMFDLNAEMTFYEYMESKFYGIAGFKHDAWEWKAYGGDYVYSSYYLYDTVGSFDDDEIVITYEQNYYTPYLGIGFSSSLTSAPITFSGRLIGSTLVYGDDKDQHHLRNILFEEEFDSGTMFAADLGGTYNFTDTFSLMLSYHHQKYKEMKGATTLTDLTTGEVMKFTGDAAGMDHHSNMVSLTAQYSF